MEHFQIKNLPLSAKLFVSLILCLIGINYIFLLLEIWMDTHMQIGEIAQGYRTFETVELIEHSFKFLFWFIGAFGITGTFFLMTTFPEGAKKFLAVFIPLGIISDIGSMWLVKFSNWFAYQMYFSGVFLAASFLFMFVVVQKELWFRKP